MPSADFEEVMRWQKKQMKLCKFYERKDICRSVVFMTFEEVQSVQKSVEC